MAKSRKSSQCRIESRGEACSFVRRKGNPGTWREREREEGGGPPGRIWSEERDLRSRKGEGPLAVVWEVYGAEHHTPSNTEVESGKGGRLQQRGTTRKA